jgi:ATPase family associated with various cellular activities (AAA)
VDPSHGQYLRGEYRDDKYELGKVSGLIEEVVPTFARSFDAASKRMGWTYELQRGAGWDWKDYSRSTNAMILSALALVTGRLQASVLVPAVRPRKHSQASDALDTAIPAGWRRLRAKCRSDPITKPDSSFGKNDPFTLTWLVELLGCMPASAATTGRIRQTASEQVKETFKKPEVPVLSRTKDRKDIPEHAFPLVRVILLAKALGQDLSGAAEVRRYLTGRLHHQLSSHEMRDSTFDPAEVVFALEGILQIDAGAVDPPLLDRVFGVLAESQQRTPYWRPVKPFISHVQGAALLPLSVEVANSLIRSCVLLDTGDGRPNRFSRHVGLFKRYSDWLLSRIVRGKAIRPNPKSAKLPAEEVQFTGWHSEHVDLPDRIHLWQTSQVLTFLLNYEVMLQRHIGFRALEEVGLSVDYRFTRARAEALTRTEYWTEVGEKKEALAGLTDPDSRYRVTGQVRKLFVEPREPGATKAPAWSMLLYGPPGTGKNGIAEDLAGALGFPLVTVTPSDFIRRGEAEVEARAQDIFDALGEQSDMVVLFDEIDRLILDRDSKDYRGQGDIFQLMTPSMLPKLKRLRERKRVVVVVNTNYADRIDPAAKRPGRIDQQFLVAPPDLKQRNGIIRFLLQKETEDIWGEDHDWFKLAGDVTKRDVAGLSKRTALAVFTELAQWIRGVVRGLPDGKAKPTKATLLKELADAYDDLPSGTVRLLSYDSRFRRAQKDLVDPDAEKQDKDFTAAQEPFDEFLLLLYLKLEIKRKGGVEDGDERKLARRVVGRLVNPKRLDGLKKSDPAAVGTVTEALGDKVKNSQVVELIVRRAADWLP